MVLVTWPVGALASQALVRGDDLEYMPGRTDDPGLLQPILVSIVGIAVGMAIGAVIGVGIIKQYTRANKYPRKLRKKVAAKKFWYPTSLIAPVIHPRTAVVTIRGIREVNGALGAFPTITPTGRSAYMIMPVDNPYFGPSGTTFSEVSYEVNTGLGNYTNMFSRCFVRRAAMIMNFRMRGNQTIRYTCVYSDNPALPTIGDSTILEDSTVGRTRRWESKKYKTITIQGRDQTISGHPSGFQAIRCAGSTADARTREELKVDGLKCTIAGTVITAPATRTYIKLCIDATMGEDFTVTTFGDKAYIMIFQEVVFYAPVVDV